MDARAHGPPEREVSDVVSRIYPKVVEELKAAIAVNPFQGAVSIRLADYVGAKDSRGDAWSKEDRNELLEDLLRRLQKSRLAGHNTKDDAVSVYPMPKAGRTVDSFGIDTPDWL